MTCNRFFILFCALILFSVTVHSDYSRRDYRHWIDEDRDCQNSRAEVLIATSIDKVEFRSDKNCVVKSGFWVDPFSGKSFFKASDLDIDHIIPLKAAHESGASRWPASLKKKFANDPSNLVAVSKRLNRQKGAKGPLEWMPPNESYQCDYLAKWRQLAQSYALEVKNQNKIDEKFNTLCQSVELRIPANSEVDN